MRIPSVLVALVVASATLRTAATAQTATAIPAAARAAYAQGHSYQRMIALGADPYVLGIVALQSRELADLAVVSSPGFYPVTGDWRFVRAFMASGDRALLPSGSGPAARLFGAVLFGHASDERGWFLELGIADESLHGASGEIEGARDIGAFLAARDRAEAGAYSAPITAVIPGAYLAPRGVTALFVPATDPVRYVLADAALVDQLDRQVDRTAETLFAPQPILSIPTARTPRDLARLGVLAETAEEIVEHTALYEERDAYAFVLAASDAEIAATSIPERRDALVARRALLAPALGPDDRRRFLQLGGSAGLTQATAQEIVRSPLGQGRLAAQLAHNAFFFRSPSIARATALLAQPAPIDRDLPELTSLRNALAGVAPDDWANVYRITAAMTRLMLGERTAP